MINEVADQRVERRPLVERSSPKASTSYTDYKDILRFDFFYSCAYCTMTECEARGITFEIDHYESKRARSDLIAEYSNLMWSCEECNGLKLDLIPPKKARADGYRFFRPDEDIYEDHFEPDGFRVAPKTNVGEFTIDGVRLNRLSLRRLRDWSRGSNEAAARLLHRFDASRRAQERRADGSADGSGADGGAAPVVAAFCRQRDLVGRRRAGQGARDGAAGHGKERADRGVDHRRHLVPQARQAFGRGAAPILRSTRQAGQLPGGGVAVDCQSCRQPSGGLSAVFAGRLEQGSCTSEQGGRAEGDQVQDQATDRT